MSAVDFGDTEMSRHVMEPLRDRIGRVLFEEPGADRDWYAISEERREPWRKDADRIIELLVRDGIMMLKPAA